MRTICGAEKAEPFLVIGILLVAHIPLDASAQALDSITGAVKMQERSVYVTVYYYEGEEEWGRYIFEITTEALPILEDLAGFAYPHDFDVVIYPKRSEEINMWNAQNLLSRGIWINRDRFTPENIKSWSITAVLIHENVHYWSDDALYEKPWLKEGYCELFAYLALERMGREKEAAHRKGDWAHDLEENRYYNIPLDMFEYEAAGPGNETTLLAYSKSALFCYEIYTQCGLEAIQKINEYLYLNGIAADSFMYMRLLEEYTGEDQEELFMEWVFPKRVDLETWQNTKDKISELEVLVDSSLSYMEATYGFHKIMDFVELHMHIDTQIKMAKSCIRKYDFAKALQIISEEIEKINKGMSEFDGYALRYFEAEEYYDSLNGAWGEIPEDTLLAAKERLLSFEYDLFTEQLAEFYEEMEKLEMYHTEYTEWCMGEGCTSFSPLDELLLTEDYEEVIQKVDNTVAAIQEYEATEKELVDSDWFTVAGIFFLKSEEDYKLGLESAREQIKNGDLEDALSILASVREEISKARWYGGIGFGGLALGLGSCAAFFIKRRKYSNGERNS